jgi:hypothetical protein
VGPGPVARAANEAGADGVEHDVAAGLGKVLLALDRPGREPVGEQVPEAAVAGVELERVGAVDEVERAREVGDDALDDQVVMRSHQAERVHPQPVAPDGDGEQGEEEPPVVVVAEDEGAVHPSGDHVEDAVREVTAERSGHATSVGRAATPSRHVERSSRFRHT